MLVLVLLLQDAIGELRLSVLEFIVEFIVALGLDAFEAEEVLFWLLPMFGKAVVGEEDLVEVVSLRLNEAFTSASFTEVTPFS